MIVLEKESWWRMFFARQGSVLPRVGKRLAAATLFALTITLLYDFGVLDKKFTFTTLPFTLIGTALAIFLGFRNNSSYDRFWEGRKLWGRMINITRTFSRQLFMFTDTQNTPEAQNMMQARRVMIHRLIAYLHAFRHHLRAETDFEDCKKYLSAQEYAQLLIDPNPPIYLLHQMGLHLGQAWHKNWVDTYHLPTLEYSMTTMTDIQGGCERIKKTPIPFSYTILMHRIVGIYCFALPFGIYKDVGDLTPIVVFLIAYSFFGLDSIGAEIEEPFGYDPNDLPLNTFCVMLERECLTRLGETDLPKMPAAKHHILD